MVMAFAAAYFALEGEIKRRKIPLDPYTVVAIVAFAGTSSIRLPTA
jgi:hypothetical protein